jgi:hypothetical protein
MSDSVETVVLVLKDVIFRHDEAKFLDEYLSEKYGFIIEEDKIRETQKIKNNLEKEKENISANAEQRFEETRKYSATKVLSGNYSDAEIKIQMLGEITQKEDLIKMSEQDNYTVYSSKHQLIKIASKSGYAITQFIEQLSVDLGLEIKAKEWFFHRSNIV